MTPVRRSDATRAAILAAARTRFSEDGFERTTIRAVASDARIDASMVMRYFGNKEGLFVAAIDVDLALPDVTGVATEELGRLLVTHFLDLWESGSSAEPLRLLLTSAATRPEAAARAQAVLSEQVVPFVRRSRAARPVERAGLVASQLLGFALCRYVLLLPPVSGLSRARAVAWLSPTIQRYLDGPVPR